MLLPLSCRTDQPKSRVLLRNLRQNENKVVPDPETCPRSRKRLSFWNVWNGPQYNYGEE